MQNLVLDNAIVQAIAAEVGRDAAQVVLKWALQHGQVSAPVSIFLRGLLVASITEPGRPAQRRTPV